MQEQTTGMGGEGLADPTIIDKLKEKAQIWARKVVMLYNTDVPPALQPEKDKLLKWAKLIKTSVEKIFGTMDELTGAGLGFVPLIPLAVVAAAAAAITKWSFDYAKLLTKLDEAKRLEAQGVSPERAAAIVESKYNTPSIFSGAGKALLPLGLAAVAAFYFLG